MIKVSRKAIEEVIEETLKRAQSEDRIKYQLDLEKKVKKEKPSLFFLIHGVSKGERKEILTSLENYQKVSGYQKGAYLTLRILEAQAEIDGTRLPEITKDDTDTIHKRALKHPQSIETEFERIQKKDKEFGNYVAFSTEHLRGKGDKIAEGFVVGTACVYLVFEEAYKRTTQIN